MMITFFCTRACQPATGHVCVYYPSIFKGHVSSLYVCVFAFIAHNLSTQKGREHKAVNEQYEKDCHALCLIYYGICLF